MQRQLSGLIHPGNFIFRFFNFHINTTSSYDAWLKPNTQIGSVARIFLNFSAQVSGHHKFSLSFLVDPLKEVSIFKLPCIVVAYAIWYLPRRTSCRAIMGRSSSPIQRPRRTRTRRRAVDVEMLQQLQVSRFPFTNVLQILIKSPFRF